MCAPPQTSKISVKAFRLYCFLTKRRWALTAFNQQDCSLAGCEEEKERRLALTQEMPGSRTGLYSKQSRTIKQEGEAGRAGDGECDFKEKSISCRELLQKELLKEMTPMGCSLLSDPHFRACLQWQEGTEGWGGTWRGHPHPEQQGPDLGSSLFGTVNKGLIVRKSQSKHQWGKEIRLQWDHMNLGKRLSRCLP